MSKEDIQALAAEFSLEWFECSAKTGSNVEEAFGFLAEAVTRKYEFEVESLRNLALSQDSEQGSKKKKCC